MADTPTRSPAEVIEKVIERMRRAAEKWDYDQHDERDVLAWADELEAALSDRPAPREQEPEGKVTRLTVVDENGRRLERWNVSIDLSYQDDGRTLKVFVTPNQPAREQEKAEP